MPGKEGESKKKKKMLNYRGENVRRERPSRKGSDVQG